MKKSGEVEMTRQKARGKNAFSHRLTRLRTPESAGFYQDHLHGGSQEEGSSANRNVVLDCGWGRLLFAQTFENNETIIEALRAEAPASRDILFYVSDPHVLLSQAPQEIFLDPSHTFRLELSNYRAGGRRTRGISIRRAASEIDADGINAVYAACGMVQLRADFFSSERDNRAVTYFVAQDDATGEIVGTVTGINHQRLFNDPDQGGSLWCLAVHPQARQPGIGEKLVRKLAEHFQARGLNHVDLSVLYDNDNAIRLYEKLKFRRVPLFAIKRKNAINEKFFALPISSVDALNPYARIIVDEALRRGVHVDITDAKGGFFRLSHGGRSIHCRESLSEMTSGVAMSICDDKAVTRRTVAKAGLVVPQQIPADGSDETLGAFLEKHGKLVVKPARGEQGRGISVGISTMKDLRAAIRQARDVCDNVLLEACFEGEDLRLVIIDYKLVAAAVRRPPRVIGDGKSTIRKLIETQSRRRLAATGGESRIPIDAETKRCLEQQGLILDDVLADRREITVRKAANLHTGGTIHDVTATVDKTLVDAACKAARAIEIPVVGIDFMVKSPETPEYVFIEANERPGLANHEPQPTAARFVECLFPQLGTNIP
ncbi:N-acetylglutaminylglutamine synthetase [Brucella pituitosa]|uniref:N-acetylglutaminylglutamine synthetase n=1 Tax=Brucella pituitosa TaxID=571256 RepID=UPI000C270167|nr:N-acetylglutaminylglutamine synthetase [Brucella pituitosa]MCK4207021.1 N-acetylglutaminylglutamine synthetase [Brucella pituitosa]PJO49305.1 N-acetylglutaminylglutamine synthetase [Brucella pituitosa]PRA84153.1 N-acetylglutaminylglutamine synthetase [Ochrobactrum sp. MYb29]